MSWVDTTTVMRMLSVEQRQGYKIGCIEEVAWRHGWIDDDQLLRLADGLAKSGYGDYLRRIVRQQQADRARMSPRP